MILIQLLIIVYLIKLTLAKYFAFSRFDISISNKSKVVSNIGTFIVLALSIL